MTASKVANWLSRPRVSNIIKKSTAQNGEPGIRNIASVITTNASPGPDLT